MTLDQLIRDDDALVRQYEYDEEAVVVVDFGRSGAEASVDVVDGTVIVVFDSAERSAAGRSGGDAPAEDDDQYEFALPEGATDAQAFIKNGVLTLELEVDS